jgi:hypothetical protein
MRSFASHFLLGVVNDLLPRTFQEEAMMHEPIRIHLRRLLLTLLRGSSCDFEKHQQNLPGKFYIGGKQKRRTLSVRRFAG